MFKIGDELLILNILMTNYLQIISAVGCTDNPFSSLRIMLWLYCSNFMHGGNGKSTHVTESYILYFCSTLVRYFSACNMLDMLARLCFTVPSSSPSTPPQISRWTVSFQDLLCHSELRTRRKPRVKGALLTCSSHLYQHFLCINNGISVSRSSIVIIIIFFFCVLMCCKQLPNVAILLHCIVCPI